MNKEFIPYEQALELRELGFDEECMAYWTSGLNGYYIEYNHYTNKHWMFNANDNKDRDKMCTAPLYQQAFRWFREKGIVNSIRSHNDKCHDYYFIHNGKAFQSFHSSTYEQAELECLSHLIRILNQNK